MIFTLKDNRYCISWLVKGSMDYFCILLWNGKIFLALLFVLRSFVILTMTCYVYSISQNIQIGVIITPKHMLTKQRPAHLSCSQKDMHYRTHAHQFTTKRGLTQRSHLFIYCHPSFVCANVFVDCVALSFYYATADKQVTSVTLLLIWT